MMNRRTDHLHRESRPHRRRSSSCSRSGMTLVELMIGMMITALVAAAVAAMLMAVSRGWENSQELETQTTVSSQGMMRIGKMIRNARQIGACRAGGLSGSIDDPAAMLFWRGDLNDDGKIQFSELALLEHNPDADSTHQIPAHAMVYWEVKFPAGWTDEQKAHEDFEVSSGSFYNDSEIDNFRNNCDDLVKPTLLARDVAAAQFNRVDSQATVRPALEYAVKFQDADQSDAARVKYGRTTLRAPAKLAAGYP